MARKKDNNGMETHTERMLSVTMEDVMHNSMLPYAEYVILDRAIPRVEDGLKPVQRRILYTMMELSLTPDKPHRKSARIVGDCLGKYHPHGDTSVYDAMVRMAQPFNMSATLVDGHGNFGSMDGDPAAAMRYTEARMTPLALELLRDIDKDTVEFSLNFDDTLKEPDVLPGRFPNLLVNGASGIAVGLATNIPPHNLGEAIDATVAMLNKPDITVKELMAYMPGPDFPTGGLLLDTDEIAAAYETGRGRLVLRAKTHIEPQKNGKSLIVVTELPFQVNKAAAQEKILKLSESKKTLFAGIADIREESDREGTRVVIEVKKDADPEKILNYLYKYSDLQVNFGVNMVAIAEGKPKLMGLKEVLSHYIAHQKDVVTRRTRHDLEAAERRAHILEGLIIAVDNVDEVIRMIRASETPAEARDALMKRFALTQIQAQAILDMRLARLTSLQIIELRAEYDEILKLIAELKSILENPGKLIAVIRRELLEIKKKYAVPRRTSLINGNPEITVDESELKVVSDVTVYATASGIKRVAAKLFAQKGTQEEGRTFFAIDTRTDKRVQFFTNRGTMYSIDAEDIPEPKGKQLGSMPAALFAGWNDDERIVAAFSFDAYPEEQSLLFFTKQGMAKRASLAEFETRNKKYAAIGLKDGDEVISVVSDNGLPTVLMITTLGMSIRFLAESIPQMGRTAAGVKAITLELGDSVLFAEQVPDDGQMLLISDLGYAKRSLILDYECQNRNGKGQRTFELKKSGANGTKIAAAMLLTGPVTFAVEQLRSGKTVFASEEVLVEKRQSRGLPLVMAMLDDVVIDAYIADDRTQKG
ncbi:MAG: DNA gyrase/topoisomerase IV subunit A [Christensenellales bacterium]|jgi:DNA gyrase subunit A